MASDHTANYGLCQWEPGDKFVRMEFNGDNERVDAALREVSTAASGAREQARRVQEGLEQMGYNVYNLILQDYYDGKLTGYKKALVFDGFLDGSGIASKSGELILRDSRLTLSRMGQTDIGLGYGGSRNTALTSRTVTASGSGKLTGFRLKTYLDWSDDASPRLGYDLTVNGVSAASGTKRWSEPCTAHTENELTLSFPQYIQLLPGDKLALSISQTGNMWPVYAAVGGGLGGTFLVTPTTADRAVMTSLSHSLPAAASLLGWARHSGGSVELSVVDNQGEIRPMTVGESRSTTEPGGKNCTEIAFALDGALPAGNTAFRLELSLGGSESMSLYDYALCLY